ncbi:hypothetical protein GCM10020229_47430 [Kitasatospora albolonga]
MSGAALAHPGEHLADQPPGPDHQGLQLVAELLVADLLDRAEEP